MMLEIAITTTNKYNTQQYAPLNKYLPLNKSTMISNTPMAANKINTYPLIEKHITSLFPDCKKDISNFMLQNYMGAIMAMCKNQNYDSKNLRWIHKYVKNHLKDFILYSPFAIYWKVGVTIFAINTKVFCCLCNVFR